VNFDAKNAVTRCRHGARSGILLSLFFPWPPLKSPSQNTTSSISFSGSERQSTQSPQSPFTFSFSLPTTLQFGAPTNMPPKFNIEEWVKNKYTTEYLDTHGKRKKRLNVATFEEKLQKERPNADKKAIATCIKKLDDETYEMTQDEVKELDAWVKLQLEHSRFSKMSEKKIVKELSFSRPQYHAKRISQSIVTSKNRKQAVPNGHHSGPASDNIAPKAQQSNRKQAVQNERQSSVLKDEIASMTQQTSCLSLGSSDSTSEGLTGKSGTTSEDQSGTAGTTPKDLSPSPSPLQGDYPSVDFLRPDDHDSETSLGEEAQVDISSAPLFSGAIVQDARGLLPQYGFLGTHSTEDDNPSTSDIFVNTKVPFSVFICGVQGSGKSHTTSCFMENGLISSQLLGPMGNPLSALVLSYGDYGSGAAFSVSEAAYLASRNSALSGHSAVKEITVLTSPTNPGIRRLYNDLPNVTAIPFKMKPQSLDIATMLTLMAVDSSDSVPLYMAKVTSILREMATAANDDGFDYLEFKSKLWACDFNPAQTAMLELRLGLLDTFLDLGNTFREPTFRPGEITIMDMSCPFIDANTACILFKIGMKMYLGSQNKGKMIVLDEAHKYMLKVPGAKELNEYLLTVIRLQRHLGARVIVSTQEPTLLTDLIALCSVTVIHRFSSPEWMAAIKKHIDITDSSVLKKVETLRRGNALVYVPNAVLGRNEDGSLIKGNGKLLEMKIRKRVTADGGQSVLAS
jgi:hypothetical protein